MNRAQVAVGAGLTALRIAVLHAAGVQVAMAPAGGGPAQPVRWEQLLAEALETTSAGSPGHRGHRPSDHNDAPETARLVALVDLARDGDAEAFGQLYDHYSSIVYRFLYYRVGSHQLAEDLASETFFRALRSLSGFKWQGKDFGAWLITISRNLVADHYKSGRNRLEITTDDLSEHDTSTASPEDDVITSLTNETLLSCLRELAAEQQECLVLRFLQGLTIAETASAMDRSEGAVKQLQLRAVRNLAKLLPEGVR